jgi:hypothetical protein
MSDTNEVTEVMKTVDERTLIGPEIQRVDFGLPTTHRCIRCEMQAYVEIEIHDQSTGKKRNFEMCAHHYGEHESALELDPKVTRIIDHRPFLHLQERAFKGQAVTQ